MLRTTVSTDSHICLSVCKGVAICGRTEVAKENPTGTILVADGEWHMLAWVYNGDQMYANVSIYGSAWR